MESNAGQHETRYLASSLTCDFNMIKNYTHGWLLLVAAYHASRYLSK